jgi:GNAT superfamily N-acetyltransferase
MAAFLQQREANLNGGAALRWEAATDADEIHALLCASDQSVATLQAPAPQRNRDTTRRLVRAGATQVLRGDGGAIASFNLLDAPPFDESYGHFPPARRPLYLGRLAVRPESTDSLVGAQCVRRAIELARAAGADALRAETNPDLVRMIGLLRAFGFVEYGGMADPDGRRRSCLQLSFANA